jgi:hypothetical protein
MSACGLRILVVIGLCLVVFLAGAQDHLLSDSELDRLPIWHPVYKPIIRPGDPPVQSFLSPTGYENIAELADRAAKPETVQSVQINSEVLKKEISDGSPN